MIALPENPTGADLLAALRRHAVARGVTTMHLARKLSAQPSAWLIQLDRAKRPSPTTVARVRALISGEPLPDLPIRRFLQRSEAQPEPVYTGPSGADLAKALRRAAADRGISLAEFCRPAARDPSTWVHQLANARRPKSETIAKVQALLAQDAHAPAIERRPTAPPPARLASPTPPPPGPPAPPVIRPRDRNPCFRCGTNGDRGCIHYPLEMRA